MWSLLRGGQLCNLKFRRQHPIGPYYADFACVSSRLVVEIDGACHDATIEQDFEREKYLTQEQWKVVRFSADDVERDAEAVVHAIARELGLAYEFSKRAATGSGSHFIDGR